MIGALLTYLIAVPAAVLSLYPMKNQLRYSPKKTALTLLLTLCVTIPVMSFIASRLQLPPNALLFPILVLYFFLYHHSLKVHISKSLAIFGSIMSLMGILAMYATWYDAARHPELGSNSYTLDYALLHLFLGCVFALLLAYPLTHYGSWLIDQVSVPSIWYWTLPFSFLMLATTLRMRPVKYETFHVNHISEAIIVILTFLLLFWILAHLIFYFIVRGILEATRTQEEKRILEMQENQFQAQQRYMNATARERHDFRHNLRALCELYDSGEYEDLGEYLHQYVSSQPFNEVQPFCSNNALNAALNYYVHMAIQMGIDIQIETRLPDSLPISDIDLCRIVGNVLENAITGAQGIEDKWIRLSLTVIHDTTFYLVATNSFDGKVNLKDGRYLSRTHKGLGIGLSSIESTARSYGGMATFSHEGNEFYTNVAIPL